ncbi:TIGR04104 family putative zinc finger protein [Bacillus sp. AK031]
MQNCEQCNNQFSWGSIYRSLWGWMYKPIKCEKCGSLHNITLRGRFASTFLTVVPMLLFVNLFSPFNNITVSVAAGLSIAFLGSLLTPYFVTYKIYQ